MGERDTTQRSGANAASAATQSSERAAPADAPSPTVPLSHSPALPTGAKAPLIAQSQVRVRYVETDQMGFAHHSNYFAWFEIGRTDFIRALGTSYARLEREGLILAIGEAAVRYLHAAHYDEVLVVHTWLERVQSRSVTFAYEVVRTEPAPETRIATATMKLIALDANGTIRTLPTEFRRRLQEVAAPGVA